MADEALFEQLKHPNPNLQQRAMWEIAENRDEKTIPRLMANLESENMSYRRASVKALGVIGHDAVPALVDSLLNSNNSTIRASCTKALAQVAVNYPEEAFPTLGMEGLMKALQDQDAVVHIAAAMALGAIGSQAFDILATALESTDNLAVAVAIINAIGSMGDKRGLEILTKLAEDESTDAYIQESAKSGLSRLEMIINYNK